MDTPPAADPAGPLGPAPRSLAGEEPERWRALASGFRDAARRCPERLRGGDYRFGGRSVRVRVVGERFAARTLRAFGHLRTSPPPPPTLTIDLWDEAETSVARLPDAASSDLERGWVACDGLLTASADGRYVSFRYRESVTILDRSAQRILGCRRDGAQLSGGEYSKPLLMMLSIWYHDRGVQLLHTGLVAHAGAGVLLPGTSGSGKSTTSLAGLVQGLEFLGDDFVGVERDPAGGFVGHSLFDTACLVRDNVGRFPELRPHAVDDGSREEEKPILFLSELFPERVRATVPIRAVALVRIGHERAEIRPARPAEAMLHVAASTLHTVVPRPGRDALETIAALLQSVPVWWLRLGPDLAEIPPSIARIAASGARARAG